MIKQGGRNRNSEQQAHAEAWDILQRGSRPKDYDRSATSIHNAHGREKPLDVTRVLPEYSLARLIHSYRKLDRQLSIAIRKNRKEKVEKLVVLMMNCKAMIEQVQARTDKSGMMLNLTNDPKSVRTPAVSTYKGHVVRRGHSRTLQTPSRHTVNLGDKHAPVNVTIERGKRDTYPEIGAEMVVTRGEKSKPKENRGAREQLQLMKEKLSPSFAGGYTEKQRQFAKHQQSLADQRKKLES